MDKKLEYYVSSTFSRRRITGEKEKVRLHPDYHPEALKNPDEDG
jgi:hypothetical protein